MKRLMAGYGGTLVFYLDDAGNPVGLEILAHWSPYTPRIPAGLEWLESEKR